MRDLDVLDGGRPAPIVRRSAVGLAAAIGSATALGVATVLSRSLAREGLSPATVLTARFGISALVLAVVVARAGRSLRPARGEGPALLLLGFGGFGLEASLFFAGLERAGAAAITVIFYSYPALVAVLDLLVRRARPTAKLVGALALAGAGTVLVVTGGGELALTPAAAAFALGAAAVFALYLFGSDVLLVDTEPTVRAAWVSGGAAVSVGGRGLLLGGFDHPGSFVPHLVAVGAVTGLAFALLYLALGRIGAARTAVVLHVEVVAAAVLAAAFLGEVLRPSQLLGGLAVLGAALWVAAPGAPTIGVAAAVPAHDRPGG